MKKNILFISVHLLVLFSIAAVSTATAGSYGKAKSKTIVDVAAGSEDFSTLVAALEAADLVETLEGEGPFTVLAPTNEAFAKLPAGTVETLLKPENKDQLIAVLTYHVIPGKAKAADVIKLDSVNTVNGAAVKIQVTDGNVSINEANVTATDVAASNGVIHIIDTVLLP